MTAGERSELIRRLGVCGVGDALPTSSARFPDGAQYRVEIPSTEGPGCLDVALEEAERLGVPVHRFSQGSGVFMLTDRELDHMARSAADAGVEVSLFARPGAAWGVSAAARVNAAFAAAAHGTQQLEDTLADVQRAAAHGFRSVLLADVGALWVFREARAAGVLPATMQAKTSVMLPVANPATARVLEELGASTINVAPDLPLAEIAAIRAAVSVPLDVYVEAPDDVGGFVRLHEIPELVRVAAPVYVKFGLRNAPGIYPSGSHLDETVVRLTRERVRRAALGLELLERSGVAASGSARGAAGLAVPEPSGR
jgi:hypothetical protein